MNKKNLIVLLTLFLMAVFASACAGSSDQNDNADNNNNSKVANDENNSGNELSKTSADNDADQNSEDSVKNDAGNSANETSEENAGQAEAKNEDASDNGGNDALAEHSSEEIEYARIWLQLGDTQEIDELNVQHFSSGEPLNPDDETSIDYPEDVIQLSGSRLVEGSITYSGNGDGTIKLYKIPQRWDGKNPAGEDAYKQIIEDTEQVSIDTGDDKKVEALIKKLNIQP